MTSVGTRMRGKHVAHVEVDPRARDDARLAGARGQALHAREPGHQRRVLGHRRRKLGHRAAVDLAPGVDVRSLSAARSSLVIAQS